MKQKWMTEEILILMDERRQYRQNNREEYKRLHRLIQTKIRQAKTKYINTECAEIERLQRIHDDLNVHKKIKETTGTNKQSNNHLLVNDTNNIIIDLKEKAKLFANYVNSLF